MQELDIDIIVKIIEIAGGFAVLISIMFLGKQLYESNKYARAESLANITNLDFLTAEMIAIAGLGLNDFKSLSYKEKAHFHLFIIRISNRIVEISILSKMGLVDDKFKKAWDNVFISILVTKGAKDYWYNYGGRNFHIGPEIEEIESFIKENEDQIIPFNKVLSWMDLENIDDLTWRKDEK